VLIKTNDFLHFLDNSLAQVPQAKTNVREKEKQILDKILQPNLYDRRIRPSGANGTGMQIYLSFLCPSIPSFLF
jgi:hypothetical protein